MAQIRQLGRPPITEALVDIRTPLLPVSSLDSFALLRSRLIKEYPKVEELRRFQAMFTIQQGQAVSAKHGYEGVIGLKFSTRDGLDVAQFRLDGFTYNRLEPYTSWAQIKPKALDLWQHYVQVAKPGKVDRVALRYINRLSIPPSGDLGDHLALGPPVFPGAPEVVSEFVLRVQSHDPGTRNQAVITQALEPPGAAPHVPLILDIEVSNGIPRGTAVQDLESILDTLRNLKNEIFFGMITDETAERYQ